MIHTEVKLPNLDKAGKEIITGIDKNIKSWTKAGSSYMAGMLSGSLKKSVGYDSNSIWANKTYKYVDEGTKPHKIEGLLVFRIHGATIFSHGVNHPGTKPQHITDKLIKFIEGKYERKYQ